MNGKQAMQAMLMHASGGWLVIGDGWVVAVGWLGVGWLAMGTFGFTRTVEQLQWFWGYRPNVACVIPRTVVAREHNQRWKIFRIRNSSSTTHQHSSAHQHISTPQHAQPSGQTGQTCCTFILIRALISTFIHTFIHTYIHSL
jgi:hypothetical protein